MACDNECELPIVRQNITDFFSIESHRVEGVHRMSCNDLSDNQSYSAVTLSLTRNRRIDSSWRKFSSSHVAVCLPMSSLLSTVGEFESQNNNAELQSINDIYYQRPRVDHFYSFIQ